MKVFVEDDLCIACGNCIEICPEVFQWNDEGISEAVTDEVPPDMVETAHEAVESCPTDAIKEEGAPKGISAEAGSDLENI